MLECSYEFGGEYGWRVSLSGAAVFDSAVDSSAQVPLLGNNRGGWLRFLGRGRLGEDFGDIGECGSLW